MKTVFLLSILFLCFSHLFSQRLELGIEDALIPDEIPPAQPVDSEVSFLPTGFENITIATSLSEVQDLLRESSYFIYRPEDVSFRPYTNIPVITVEGRDFIERALFQFNQDEELIALFLYLDQEQFDYYTVYSTLTQRYGRPEELNPSRAFWKDVQTMLLLEKPLTIKYMMSELFITTPNVEEPLHAKKRENFLKEF